MRSLKNKLENNNLHKRLCEKFIIIVKTIVNSYHFNLIVKFIYYSNLYPLNCT